MYCGKGSRQAPDNDGIPMEVIDALDHTIEPELLSPIPRRTYYRRRKMFLLVLLFQFGMILLLGLGFAMFVYFCLELTLGNSPPLHGRILAIKMPQDTPSADPEAIQSLTSNARNAVIPRLPTLEYTFNVNGREIEDSTTIMPEQVKLLPESDAVRIRCLPYLIDLGHRPILPNDTFWGWIGILGIVTLLTNVVIGTLCWFAFVLPSRQRELCRSGYTAAATVIRKDVWGMGGNSCIVHYRFELDADRRRPGAAPSGERDKSEESEQPCVEVIGQMRLPKSFWDHLDAGDKVTVLYSPKDPENNVLYQPGMYAVVPSTYAVIRVREDTGVRR
jgi:hypothetical protein